MVHRRLLALSAVALVALPATAWAHGTAASSFEPWLRVALAAAAIAYGLGIAKLWSRAGVGRGIRTAQVARFAAGWIVLAAALLSPLFDLAQRAFAIHMIQHELLMVVAAPLLVLSRPLEAWTWALPHRARRALAKGLAITRLRDAGIRLTSPASAWCFHALALWTWHLPALFAAALSNEAVHVAQHGFFFASALVFWWAVFGRGSRAPDAASIPMLFTTMLHTGALGLLLTFSPTAWYAERAPEFLGMSALEDQQLGGLVMWAPGSLAYLVAGLVIVAAWLSPSGRREALH